MLVITAVGAGLRLWGAQGDLWLDEVWSIHRLNEIVSPWEVVTKLRHDNNHVLNSWCLWLMRGVEPEWLVRLPAVLGGAASVALAWWFAAGLFGDTDTDETQADRAAFSAALAALVAAGAYPWVLYGSEARGYSFAIAAALGAATALVRGTRADGKADTAGLTRWGWRFAFWSACVVGVLAQPIFIAQALAPLVVWCAIRAWHKPGGGSVGLGQRAARWLFEVVTWNAIPLAFAWWFYEVFLSQLNQGGGTASGWLRGISNAAGLALGIPVGAGDPLGATLRIICVLVVTLAASWVLWRRGGSAGRWALLLYSLVIPLGTALQLALSKPSFLYERYMLISMAFMTLLPVHALVIALFPAEDESAGQRSGARFTAIIGAVVVMLIGHAWSLTGLFDAGRGRYRDALVYIVEHSPRGSISIAGDHDFRSQAMVLHYRTSMPGGNRIIYIPQNRLPADGVRWYLIHSPTNPTPPDAVFYDTVRGQRYVHRATFNTGSLSGFHWFVFERENAG